MVPDAAWPGSNRPPWGTASAAGPLGRLGRPVRPIHGVWFAVICPSAVLGVYVFAVSLAPWPSLTGVRTRSMLCAVSFASCPLFTAWCVVFTVSVASHRWVNGVCASSNVRAMSLGFGLCSPVCALGVLCVWCPWPLGACSPVCGLGVLCVLCTWRLGGCSLVCVPGVCCVQCPWALGACSALCVHSRALASCQNEK